MTSFRDDILRSFIWMKYATTYDEKATYCIELFKIVQNNMEELMKPENQSICKMIMKKRTEFLMTCIKHRKDYSYDIYKQMKTILLNTQCNV